MKQADRDKELQKSAQIKAEADARANTATAIKESLNEANQSAPLHPIGEIGLAIVRKEIEDKQDEVVTGKLHEELPVTICELDHQKGTTCPGCNQYFSLGRI